MPHELPNDLRSWEIRKYQGNLRTSENNSLVASLPAKMEILLILAKISRKIEIKFSRSALFHMKTRVSLKYFVNGYSQI